LQVSPSFFHFVWLSEPEVKIRIALDDVAIDAAARSLAEDGEFIPTGAVDPLAAVVMAANGCDAHARGRADFANFGNPADQLESREHVMDVRSVF
jgi:hypothetical protein